LRDAGLQVLASIRVPAAIKVVVLKQVYALVPLTFSAVVGKMLITAAAEI
jgi:hypothetical protein